VKLIVTHFNYTLLQNYSEQVFKLSKPEILFSPQKGEKRDTYDQYLYLIDESITGVFWRDVNDNFKGNKVILYEEALNGDKKLWSTQETDVRLIYPRKRIRH